MYDHRLSSIFGFYGELGSATVKGNARDDAEGMVDDRLWSYMFGARIRLGG